MSVTDRSGTAREDLVVARLHALAPELDGEPDPAWQSKTRARLVAMAAVRTPAPEPVSPVRRLLSRAEDVAPSRWRSRLTAGLAGAAMAVTALSTLVAVATDSGPGDALYGLKRSTEQTQLALAGDARGQTLLDFARTRLHELEDLVGATPSALPAAGAGPSDGSMVVLAADADPGLVIDTIATMDQQTRDGAAWLADRAVTTGDDAPLEDLATWTEEQSAGLAALRDDLPESTRDEVDASLALLADIDTRTVGLTDALTCLPGPAVGSADALGPVPGLCLPPAPPQAGDEGDPLTTPAVPGAGSSTESTGVTPTPGPGGGTDGVPGEIPGLPSAGVPTTGSQPTPPLPTLPPLPPDLDDPELPGGSTGTTSPTTASQTTDEDPLPDLPCVPIPPLIRC